MQQKKKNVLTLVVGQQIYKFMPTMGGFTFTRSLLKLLASAFHLMQYVPDLSARWVMGVISEHVAMEVIKYPVVFAVSGYRALS